MVKSPSACLFRRQEAVDQSNGANTVLRFVFVVFGGACGSVRQSLSSALFFLLAVYLASFLLFFVA